MCWTLCSRKNLDQSKLIISNDDAFKIWCIFNFLSEDRYPLIIVTEEVSLLSSTYVTNTQQDSQKELLEEYLLILKIYHSTILT